MYRFGYGFFQKCIIVLLLVFMGCGGDSKSNEKSPDAAEPQLSNQNQSETKTDAKFNINSATKEQFLTIPNVGDKMAHEFDEYRPYISIRQFRKEIGKYVDETQVAAYENYIYVPVDINESDAETLQQLPGVDADRAAALIAARPFANNDVFLEKLAAFLEKEDLSTAASYLKM